jgi:hypothetical protein
VNFDGRHEHILAGPRGEGVSVLVPALVEPSDDGASADEDDPVAEKGVGDFVGPEGGAVTDLGDGERWSVVSKPGGFGRIPGAADIHAGDAEDGVGETGVAGGRVAGEEAAHGEVVIDAQGGESPGGGGVAERFVGWGGAEGGDAGRGAGLP